MIEWKPVPGYPTYSISEYGDVTHADGRGLLRPCLDKPGGYRQVALMCDGKHKIWRVHRLVCLAFHGESPLPKMDVAHNDGNRENNHKSNLRWATRAENEADKVLHGRSNTGSRNGRAVLTDVAVSEIRKEVLDLPRSSGGKRIKKGALASISEKYGVSDSCIRQILSNRRWSHI